MALRIIFYISFFIFSAFCQIVKGQDQSYLDSLKFELKQTDNGKERIELLIKADSVIGYNNIDSSLIINQQILEEAQKLQDTASIALAYYNLGLFCNIQSNFKQALAYDLKAYDYARAIDEQLLIGQSLNSIGVDYFNLHQYSQAYEYLQQSFTESLANNDTSYMTISLFNLGSVLNEMKQYEKAITIIDESLKLSMAIGDTVSQAYCGNELADIYIKQGHIDRAISELRDAYDIAKLTQERVVEPNILIGMSRVYIIQENYKEALEHINQAEELYIKQSSKTGLVTTQIKRGDVYARLKDYEQALASYEKALSMALEINSLNLLIDIYKVMSDVYEDKEDYKNALMNHKRYKSLEDSLFSESQNELFTQIQLRYELAGKNNTIEALNQSGKAQQKKLKRGDLLRNALVVILAFTALMSITLYRSSERRKRLTETLLAQKKEIEVQSKEMEKLLDVKDKFLSILSHDLRSPVNGLLGILDMMDSGHLSEEELKSLSASLKSRLENVKKLLNNLLGWTMAQMNEIQIKKDKINLKQLIDDNLSFFREMNDKNIEFKSSIEQAYIAWGDANMVDVVVRNLVSNSVKFTKEKGQIEVFVEEKGDALEVNIRDNGVGMSPEQASDLFDNSTMFSTPGTADEAGTGLGLKLCKEFVERMGGKIFVESEEGKGSTFKFTLEKAAV